MPQTDSSPALRASEPLTAELGTGGASQGAYVFYGNVAPSSHADLVAESGQPWLLKRLEPPSKPPTEAGGG